MNLSKWDKLFVLNYYDGRNHCFPPKQDRRERIRKDIQEELERLYQVTKEDFIIRVDSIDLLREYESEINAKESRGEDTTYLRNHKESCLQELSEKYTDQLYEEYMHIVDWIKNANYEESFKALMLRETLLKTYKLDMKDGKKTIVGKRIMHETISGHMILDEIVLDTIYNNVDDYRDFANLYFAGLEIFHRTVAEKSNIHLENVDTYGMGYWIKFDGKASDKNNYIQNAKELSALVQETPWCTKTLASSQLSNGDFYVFVDNDKKPHIAVRMNGNEISEVRGTMNAQELEDEYRKVAISFLENNQDIKNGDKWLKKEEWNKRLIKHIEDIEKNCFRDENIDSLIIDLLGKDEYNAYEKNTNKERLIKLLKPSGILKKISEKLHCDEDEIYFGDVDFSDEEYKNLTVCPYKVIYGSASFKNSKIQSLGGLRVIVDNAYFGYSNIQSLENVEFIGSDVDFSFSPVTDLGKLRYIGGYANFYKSKLRNFGNIDYIHFICFDDYLHDLYHLEFDDNGHRIYRDEVKDISI